MFRVLISVEVLETVLSNIYHSISLINVDRILAQIFNYLIRGNTLGISTSQSRMILYNCYHRYQQMNHFLKISTKHTMSIG